MSNPASNTASILQKNKKVLIASLTGSAIEWFDYFLYGTAAALVFNKIFFPMVDPVIGLILSWLSFSLTFFIRPIGGVIFAHIGDRIGRKKTLVITLSLMGGATVLIGCLPTYEQIGVWAPILLISLRVVQGMGIGGEYAAINSAIDELIPSRYRGRVDIMVNGTYWAGAILGTLGSLIFLNVLSLSVGRRLRPTASPAAQAAPPAKRKLPEAAIFHFLSIRYAPTALSTHRRANRTTNLACSWPAPLQRRWLRGRACCGKLGQHAQTMRVISLDRPHHHYGTVAVRLGHDICLILCNRANVGSRTIGCLKTSVRCCMAERYCKQFWQHGNPVPRSCHADQPSQERYDHTCHPFGIAASQWY